MQLRKLSIIGCGEGWQEAPYDIESWGATKVILLRSVDLVIDMNDYSGNRWGTKETSLAMQAVAKANELNIPVITIKNYPYKEIVDFFKIDYFSNTIDYMIALAVYKGYTNIDLYGVNMVLEGEYAYEKPGVDYWCGRAMGMGVIVTPQGTQSTIMRTRDRKVYGYGFEQKGVLYG